MWWKPIWRVDWICLVKQTDKLPSFVLTLLVKDMATHGCFNPYKLTYFHDITSRRSITSFPSLQHWPLTANAKQFQVLYYWRKWEMCWNKTLFGCYLGGCLRCVIVPGAVTQRRFHEQSQCAQDVWHGAAVHASAGSASHSAVVQTPQAATWAAGRLIYVD